MPGQIRLPIPIHFDQTLGRVFLQMRQLLTTSRGLAGRKSFSLVSDLLQIEGRYAHEKHKPGL
jgi:hypothetical protein